VKKTASLFVLLYRLKGIRWMGRVACVVDRNTFSLETHKRMNRLEDVGVVGMMSLE
jgi:hypothetical protein